MMAPLSAGRDVVVIGAGGHARVCVEVLTDAGHRVLGCVSSDGTASADLGVEMLGRAADAVEIALDRGAAAFVAVGQNDARKRLTELTRAGAVDVVTAVSPHAVVSRSVELADGVLVMPGAVVNAGTVIGEGTIVNTRASVDHDCQVGAFVHLAPGVSVAGGVTIGEGAFLGIGSSVIPGRSIGEWAMVAAGAAVTRDVAEGGRVAGVPARPMAVAAATGGRTEEEHGSRGLT